MNPAVYWAGGIFASLLTVLRIRKVVVDSKAEAAAAKPAPAPTPAAPAPQPTPQASLPLPFPVPSVPLPTIPGLQAQVNPLSVPQPLQAQVNPLPQVAAPEDNVLPVAIVTTKDAAPSGDLIIRVAPNDSAAKIPGEGAEKNGSVTILTPDVPDSVTGETGKWAEVMWLGGARRTLPGQGFAKKQFLKIIS